MTDTNDHPGPALTIVPGRSDAEVASDLRKRMEEALSAVAAITDEASAAGFLLNFGLGPDYRQKTVITNLLIAKKF